jgi:hypothetical protein
MFNRNVTASLRSIIPRSLESNYLENSPMALRIFLVGVVASLGLDLPTGMQVDQWSCSGRDWFQSGAERVGIGSPWDELVVEVELEEPPVAARPMLAENKSESTQSEPSEPHSPLPAPIIVAEPGLANIPVFASEPGAARSDNVPEPQVAEMSQEAPNESSSQQVDALEPAPATPAAVFDQAFSGVVDQLVTGFAPSPSASSEALVVNRKPVIEPDMYPGLAYELNRLAEGLEPIQPPAASIAVVGTEQPEPIEAAPAAAESWSPSPAKSERLASAVRLTGQAFHAWISLLQQTPVVAAETH